MWHVPHFSTHFSGISRDSPIRSTRAFRKYSSGNKILKLVISKTRKEDCEPFPTAVNLNPEYACGEAFDLDFVLLFFLITCETLYITMA